MKIVSKPKRILAMVVIGVVLALIQLAIGMRPSGALIGGVLFFCMDMVRWKMGLMVVFCETF